MQVYVHAVTRVFTRRNDSNFLCFYHVLSNLVVFGGTDAPLLFLQQKRKKEKTMFTKIILICVVAFSVV